MDSVGCVRTGMPSRRQAIGFGPRAPRYRAIRAFGRNTRAPAPP